MTTAVANPDSLVPDLVAPEHMEFIDAYFANGTDLKEAALALGIPEKTAMAIYKKPEVSNYISSILMESGFLNRGRFFGLYDEIINKKIEEMNETGMVAQEKDIVDILEKLHKMKMAEMKMMIELEKVRSGSSTTHQTNIQVNAAGAMDPQYANFMEKLVNIGK
ncbi:terminase small subunit [Proteus phage 2]|nr:terminase small subunit [Proteus phage 1]QNN97809.1 terminase small subunit [Proteus phage 2]